MAAKKGPTGGRATRVRPVSDTSKKVFEAHLGQFRRLVEKRGVSALTPLYKEARSDLYERLRRAGPRTDKLSAATLRAMIGQVEGVLETTGNRLEERLRDVGRLASELGARHAVDEFARLEGEFRGTTPVLDLERGAVFRGVVDGVESSLLRRHRTVSKTWSLTAIADIERVLSVDAMTGKSLDDSIARVLETGGLLDSERWKAERIVRTEMAYGHGATKFEAMHRTQAELERPLYKRLVETFDDRTGDDSFLVHGQVVPLDQPFSMKVKRGGGWVVVEYMFPPGRPNDRAIMVPWDLEWEPSDEERALDRAELEAAPPTRWRSEVGVEVPPGHVPGRPYKA